MVRKWFHAVVGFYWGTGIADDVPALTYFLVISLAPVALGGAALATVMFGHHLQDQAVANTVGRYLPSRVRSDVVKLVLQTKHDHAGLLALAVAAMMWTTSGAIGVIERTIARYLDGPRHSVVWGRLRNVLVGTALAIMMLTATAAASLIAGLGKYLPSEAWTVFLAFINYVGSVAFCAIIFRYVSLTRLRWRAVLLGAIPTSVMLFAAPAAVGLYFTSFAKPEAVSIFFSLTVIVAGCYLLALGFLVGAGIACNVHQRIARQELADKASG